MRCIGMLKQNETGCMKCKLMQDEVKFDLVRSYVLEHQSVHG